MAIDIVLNKPLGGITDRNRVRLWMWRTLVHLRADTCFIEEDGCNQADLALELGLDLLFAGPDAVLSRGKIKRILRNRLTDAERAAANHPDSIEIAGPLAENCTRLKMRLNLSSLEIQILQFAVMLPQSRGLIYLVEAADPLMSIDDAIRAIARILSADEEAVRRAFMPQGLLARSGLLNLGAADDYGPLRTRFCFPSEDFGWRLMRWVQDPIELLNGVIGRCPPAELSTNNYDHLGDVLVVLNAYLEQAFAQQRVGVNILLWGPPGAGKTQLTRVLGQEHGVEVLEIATETPDTEPMPGPARLQALRAAQTLFQKTKVLLVFEEAEDILGSWGDERHGGVRSRKAWFNRALESNPLPTIWTMNSTEWLDPAFVRRFDLIIELPIPPLEVREAILREHCGTLLTPAALRTLARCNALAPAIITRAASVMHCVQDKLPPEAQALQLHRQLQATLQLQGHNLKGFPAHQSSPNFDPALVNATCDWGQLLGALQSGANFRLLLDGPPGSGKSACAHWLADSLGQTAEVVRSSDIVSPYVGETEQNLANLFRAARNTPCVLVIDEIDSFLAERRGARYRWEITAVNELLAQLDDFEGLLIGTTNLPESLDRAALRRFDLHVRFDFLTLTQSKTFFGQCCNQWQLPWEALNESIDAMLRQCHQLTPGDFAAVQRRHAMLPFASAAAVADALREVSLRKSTHTGSPIGFVH